MTSTYINPPDIVNNQTRPARQQKLNLTSETSMKTKVKQHFSLASKERVF